MEVSDINYMCDSPFTYDYMLTLNLSLSSPAVCRTKDIYLASSFGGSSGGLKERPRLNLTVKKELGGQVMAQSKMAKGPDDTNGFVEGWTKRISPHVAEEEEESNSLSIAAMEFVPTEILRSGE